MNNFEFYSPTKVYFGKNQESRIGEIIKSYNYKNILLVYGMSSIKKIGLYDTVINSLNNENINVDKDRLIVTYGYYDDTAHYFSIVHDIRLSDKIVQLIGAGFDNNLIRGLEDMRLTTGAFPYIRI